MDKSNQGLFLHNGRVSGGSGTNGDSGASGQTQAGGVNGEGRGSGADRVNGEMSECIRDPSIPQDPSRVLCGRDAR